MDKEEKITNEYNDFKNEYSSFQKEVYDFLIELELDSKYDIYSIEQRPKNNIKELLSIIKNIREKPEKYKKLTSITDIKDIAGIRITCHCNSDREKLYDFLEGVLKQKYFDIIGQKKDDNYYHAYHFNFYKKINKNGGELSIYCELQLRTVLSNAWAIQDSKYVYKNKVSEGEPQILSGVVSDILNSCENLWELVREKSITNGENNFKLIIPMRDDIDKKVTFAEKKLNDCYEEKKEWFDKNKKLALSEINGLGINTYTEVIVCSPSDEEKKLTDLNEAAKTSQIKTFGWPIGVFIEGREDFSPKPTADGICAKIVFKDDNIQGRENYSYDYWAIKKDGSFYMLKSLFEDQRKLGYIFFDTRIIRIAEVLMYISNLYKKIGIDENAEFMVQIKYSGIKDRIIGSAGNRKIYEQRKSSENEIVKKVKVSVMKIDNDLSELVEQIITPLFEVFDFFEIKREFLEDIVNKYKKGEIS